LEWNDGRVVDRATYDSKATYLNQDHVQFAQEYLVALQAHFLARSFDDEGNNKVFDSLSVCGGKHFPHGFYEGFKDLQSKKL
jgi:hypothetical protein